MPVLLFAVVFAGMPAHIPAGAQNQAVVRGQILDAVSLPVADAEVRLQPESATVLPSDGQSRTDGSGRFEFRDVAAGAYSLTVSLATRVVARQRVVVRSAQTMELIVMVDRRAPAHTETVTVAAAAGERGDFSGRVRGTLESTLLREMRSVATDDPMRLMQALPGAATGDDFQAEFSVRGAMFRHMGLVIDGTAAPQLLHVVRAVENPGSVALVNTDTLARASLLAGPHPARDGEWLGATLDFEVREGSRERRSYGGFVSGTAASVVGEGPIGRRGSWMTSMRRSYLDWLIRRMEPGFDSTVGFFDGTAKIVLDVTPRQQVQFLVIGGDAVYRQRDVAGPNGLARAGTGSTLASVAWRRSGAASFMSTRASFIGSQFRNTGRAEQELARGYSQAILWRADVALSVGRGWLLEGGGLMARERMNEILRDFTSSGGRLRVQAERDVSPTTWSIGGWMQATRHTDAGGVSAGVRVADRTISDRAAVSPWLLAERRTGRLAWLASIGGSAQFPAATLVHADREPVGPERARSVEVGARSAGRSPIEWRVSAYYRREFDVLRLAAEPRLDPLTRRRLFAGTFPDFSGTLEGRSHGVDVILSRRVGPGLAGWLGYTWSRTRMRDTISGERFAGDFDQRHTLNAAAQYRPTPRTSLGATLRVGSNFPIAGYFERAGGTLWLSAQRNGARLPTYARLDARASRTFTFERRTLTLFVEVMNVLGRRNLGQAEASIRSTLEVTGFAERLIPRVPSAGLLIAF